MVEICNLALKSCGFVIHPKITVFTFSSLLFGRMARCKMLTETLKYLVSKRHDETTPLFKFVVYKYFLNYGP